MILGPVLAALIALGGALWFFVLNRRHETRQRFLSEKRAAYAELIAAELEFRTAARAMPPLLTELARLASLLNRLIDGGGKVPPEDLPKWTAEMQSLQARNPVLRSRALGADLSEPPDAPADHEIITAELSRIEAERTAWEERATKSTADLESSLAVVKLLAPKDVIDGLTTAFDGVTDMDPTSSQFTGAMNALTDLLRADLGLSPVYREQQGVAAR